VTGIERHPVEDDDIEMTEELLGDGDCFIDGRGVVTVVAKEYLLSMAT